MKIIAVFLLPVALFSKQSESYYQDLFASKVGGRTEVTAGDGTRCDILTETHAIEVDFADKWGEAIGQSLNYGYQFNRKAGILLILESPADRKHLVRVNSIVRHYDLPIDVWEIRPQATTLPTTKKIKLPRHTLRVIGSVRQKRLTRKGVGTTEKAAANTSPKGRVLTAKFAEEQKSSLCIQLDSNDECC